MGDAAAAFETGSRRPSRLRRALAFQEALARRSARAVTPAAGGFAMLDSRDMSKPPR